MQNQELLLLQLLKFPVIIIKFLAKVCSVLTYLPNYLILYCIDKILFNQYLQSSRNLYIIAWLPKVILLLSAFALFAAEFIGIFWLLKLEQHSIALQIGGMILTLAGLLILMRKGYLSLLQKYNLFKLKSPVEHLELAFDFAIDILGILLWAFNTILIVRATKSWSYPYNKDIKYQFVKHITKLIRQSIMEYIQFFYVKIFFWLLWWRFADQRATYLQQKANNNLLNIFVLLNLIALTTFLDMLTIAIFAIPCLLHPKRSLYINEMNTGVQKYKITLKMFAFVTLHSLQFIICLFCLVLCWKSGIQALKKCQSYSKRQQLFGRQIPALIFQFSVKVPYLLSLSIIFLSYYKYQRLNFLLRNRQGQEQSDNYTVDKIKFTFKCFAQLLCDLLYFVIAILATMLKPWRLYWVKYLINEQYIIDHDFILKFFVKNLEEALVLPFSFFLSILVSLCDLRKPLQIYREAKLKIGQKLNKKQKESAAPGSFIPQKQLISADSLILSYSFICLQSIVHDLPHIPFSIVFKGTFLHLYMPKSQLDECTDIVPLLKHSYYKQSCLKSANIKIYEGMYTRMKASGILTIRQEYLFWKYAYKNQRIKRIQGILRAILPTKSVVKIYNNIQNQTNFSQISNQYWTNYQITKALFKKLIFLVLQIIISIIGVSILFPLTLWRIPTFIMLYSHHKDRKLFFSILGKIYKQMGRDLLMVPLKILALLIAPRMTAAFVIRTSFKYGPLGLQTFEIYEKMKVKYLLNNIYATNFRIIQILFQCILIQLCWIRMKSLRAKLSSHNYTVKKFYRMLILQTPTISSSNSLLQPDEEYFNKMVRIHLDMREVVIQFIIDIPYLFIILIVFITMPWRINYIIKTVKQMREDASSRRAFFKLLKNILKDYACIFMSIFLILSGFKTKRGLQLIKRNFHLNFFIGFLQYSYFQTLVNQMRLLMFIYRNVTCLTIAALFGWTRAHLIIEDVTALYKKKKQQQQSALANQKIYDNTVKSGKQLQILHKMGYYNYITVTSFLTLPEIIKLRRVDRLNYSMSKRQQIWFMKWQSCYNNDPSQSIQAMQAIDFQQKCKEAYIASRHVGQIKTDTYNYITGKYFRENVIERHVDLVQFAQQRFPISVYNRLFKNYEYSVALGYGPQNELPQEQNEDPQFLRLTNQVRRPIVDLNENTAWMHLLYLRLSEFLVQKMHRYFRQDRRRRVKQLVLLLGLASIAVGYIATIWFFWSNIFCINSLIGVKLLIIFYSHSFAYLMFIRCSALYNGWISLIPFNLYTDFVDGIRYLRRLIYNKILRPSGNLIKRMFKFIKDILAKIWRKMTQKGSQAYDAASIVAEKAIEGTIYYTKLAYEKVVKPLYIKIADIIRKCKDSIVSLLKAIFSSLKKLFAFSLTFFKSIYQGIAFIFSNINKLYYVILQKSMTLLLKFGIIGNLIFTIFGLILMTLPTILYFFAYPQRWYLIVSTIHTMVLIVFGYKHLNKIKASRNSLKAQ